MGDRPGIKDCFDADYSTVIDFHGWLSNELNGTHWKGGGDPHGGYSYSKALEWNNLLYTYAKTSLYTKVVSIYSIVDTRYI